MVFSDEQCFFLQLGSMMAAISTWEGMPYHQRSKGAPRWMRGKGHGLAMNVDWERLQDFVRCVEERGFISFYRGKGALHMPTFSPPKTILEYIDLGTSSAEAPVVTALALYKVYKRAALCSTKSFGFVCFEAVLHALNVIAVRSSSKHDDRWLKFTIGMTKGVHPYPGSKDCGVRGMFGVEFVTKASVRKCEEPMKGSPPSLHASIFTGVIATKFLNFIKEGNNDLAGMTKVVHEPNFTTDVVFGALGAMILRSVTKKAGGNTISIHHLRSVVFDHCGKWTSCAFTPLLSLVEAVLPLFHEEDRTVPHVLAHILLCASWRMNLEENCIKYVVLPNLGMLQCPKALCCMIGCLFVDADEVFVYVQGKQKILWTHSPLTMST